MDPIAKWPDTGDPVVDERLATQKAIAWLRVWSTYWQLPWWRRLFAAPPTTQDVLDELRATFWKHPLSFRSPLDREVIERLKAEKREMIEVLGIDGG